MKTPSLLKIVSVSALFAIFISLSAGEVLLSPRAQGNQTKTVQATGNGASTSAATCAMGNAKQSASAPGAACCAVATTTTAPKSCCASN